MPKVKEPAPVVKFIDAANEVAEAKGLTREDVVYAFEESLKSAYIRHLGGCTKDMPDPVVIAKVDEEAGTIYLAQVKKVVKNVEDDMIEIDIEDANDDGSGKVYKEGDDYVIPEVEELGKVTAIAVKNNFRQKLAEAERVALYRIYKDHIGEMMTGTVEKADDRSVSVNIGRATVELGKKELIGDETFRVGDQIKVYIQEVKSAEPTDGKPARGPQIQATRASEGFLKRLFEEEIHEIFDGTVIIKAIARQAGVRSKVAVYSNNEDVDATGACIGQGGSRIQKVVGQLGSKNGAPREKIDVINYNENAGLFIIEAARPARVMGVKLVEDEEGNKKAYAIIPNDTAAMAMGRYKSNANLTNRITGWNVEFVEENEAIAREIEYTTADEWKRLADEEKREKERAEFIRRSQEEAARKAAAIAAAEAARKAEIAASIASMPVPPKATANPEEFPAEAMNPAAAALAQALAEKNLAAERAANPVEEAVEEKQVEAVVEEAPVQQTEVKTTTSLAALEADLEAAKEKKTKPGAKTRRPRKITEDEVKREAPKPTAEPAVKAMPVYTEAELAELEKEEAVNVYDDISEDEIDEDYSEYDQYYDDDGGRN